MTQNHRRHYCRHCDTTIEATRGRHPSAHKLANVHLGVVHNLPQTIQCTRSCTMVEQPEERSLGYKRYGPGAGPAATPLKTYEDLFPEEDA